MRAESCSFFCDFALQTVTECLGFSTSLGLHPLFLSSYFFMLKFCEISFWCKIYTAHSKSETNSSWILQGLFLSVGHTLLCQFVFLLHSYSPISFVCSKSRQETMKTVLSCDLGIPWATNRKCGQTCLVRDLLIVRHKNSNRDEVDEQKLPPSPAASSPLAGGTHRCPAKERAPSQMCSYNDCLFSPQEKQQFPPCGVSSYRGTSWGER